MTDDELTKQTLSQDAIKALLSTQRSAKKVDPTETRDISTWFTLNHHSREEECDNPNCTDPRDPDDKGRKIVVSVKGQMCCRYCYLAGWLKDVDATEN
jgi:hypothetical protein